MRTTVTLDPDVEALLKRSMRDHGLTFKQALNEAVRAGATSSPTRPRTPPPAYDMGEPMVDISKALRLADELEDSERAARLARGV